MQSFCPVTKFFCMCGCSQRSVMLAVCKCWCTYTNITFTYVRMISLCIHETLAWICSAESAECPVHFPSTLPVMNSAQGTCLHVYDSTHPCIPVHPSTHPSIHLSIHPSITSSIYSSMHPSTSIHTWILLANLFVSASILYLEVSYCMVHVCMCRFNLFICLSIHKTATTVIYLYTFGSPPTRIQVAEKQICTHMYIYVRMYTCMSSDLNSSYVMYLHVRTSNVHVGKAVVLDIRQRTYLLTYIYIYWHDVGGILHISACQSVVIP